MPDQTTYRGARPTGPGAPARLDDEFARRLEARRRRERALRRLTRRARRRRNSFFAVLLLVTAVVLGFGFSSRRPPAGPGGHPASRAPVAAALPVIVPTAALTGATAGRLPPIAFPKMGESAVAFGGSGVVAESARQRPVPIASLTKIMTAYLVLARHPLTGAEQGPTLRFSAADHEAWVVASENGNSNVEINKGEVLTERQLLEALLIHSADNVADILGRWVSGSDPAFVGLMNKTARALGLSHTHYADDSGISPKSISTPADQAYLASVAMENPVFRQIVALPDVAFPVMGHIWSYNPALGVDGIIGVKSGFTPQANGCLVTAAWHMVGGHKVLEVAAVTGQRFGLYQAAQVDEALMKAASAHVHLVAPLGGRLGLARLRAAWARHGITLSLRRPLLLAGWGGLDYRARLVGSPLTRGEIGRGWAAGQVVATLELSNQFGPAASIPLVASRPLAPPPKGTFAAPGGRRLRVGG